MAVTDHQRQLKQFEVRPIHVRQPRDYVAHNVAWDTARQTLRVSNQLQAPINAADFPVVTLVHRLVEWPGLKEIASASGQLSHEFRATQAALDANRSRAEKLVLLTEVDGWPAVWVTAIDRARNAISEEDVTQLQLSSPLPGGIVPTQASDIEVRCTIWSNRSLTGTKDVLRLGWDRDRNRTLNGEPTTEIPCVPAVMARCVGMDDTGSMLMDARIEPQQVRLPWRR